MASVTGLHFRMHEEDIIKDIHDNCYVFTSHYPTSEWKIVSSILTASVTCSHLAIV